VGGGRTIPRFADIAPNGEKEKERMYRLWPSPMGGFDGAVQQKKKKEEGLGCIGGRRERRGEWWGSSSPLYPSFRGRREEGKRVGDCAASNGADLVLAFLVEEKKKGRRVNTLQKGKKRRKGEIVTYGIFPSSEIPRDWVKKEKKRGKPSFPHQSFI